jgi:hypothetical protein
MFPCSHDCLLHVHVPMTSCCMSMFPCSHDFLLHSPCSYVPMTFYFKSMFPCSHDFLIHSPCFHDFLIHSSCSDAPMSFYFIVQVPMFPCSNVFVRMVHIPYPHVPTIVYDFLHMVHAPHALKTSFTHGSCSHALMTSYSRSMFSYSNNFLCLLVHVPML